MLLRNKLLTARHLQHLCLVETESHGAHQHLLLLLLLQLLLLLLVQLLLLLLQQLLLLLLELLLLL